MGAVIRQPDLQDRQTWRITGGWIILGSRINANWTMSKTCAKLDSFVVCNVACLSHSGLPRCALPVDRTATS